MYIYFLNSDFSNSCSFSSQITYYFFSCVYLNRHFFCGALFIFYILLHFLSVIFMQLDYVARKREFCISCTLIQQWLFLVHGNTNLLYFLYASKTYIFTAVPFLFIISCYNFMLIIFMWFTLYCKEILFTHLSSLNTYILNIQGYF